MKKISLVIYDHIHGKDKSLPSISLVEKIKYLNKTSKDYYIDQLIYFDTNYNNTKNNSEDRGDLEFISTYNIFSNNFYQVKKILKNELLIILDSSKVSDLSRIFGAIDKYISGINDLYFEFSHNFEGKISNNISQYPKLLITRKSILTEILNTRFTYRNVFNILIKIALHKKFSIEINGVNNNKISNQYLSKISLTGDYFKLLLELLIEKRKFSVTTEYYSERLADGYPQRSLYKKFLLYVYFYTMPLHAWFLTKNVKFYYKELSSTQWLNRSEILDLQLKKLKDIIIHSYNHVPYYRELFDKSGITPEDINSIEDLKKIPFLSKKEISDNIVNKRILSDNHLEKDILKIVTSGSTGVPFICFADRYQIEMRWAATLRSMEWTGYVFGDKCVRLWHQTIGMTKIQVLKEYIDAFLSRRIFIPAYSISSEKIHSYMKKIEKWNPVLIDGYAESFNFLAQYLKSGNSLKIKPKSIISSAQILPSQSRTIISETFDTTVYDKYGSREFSGIAYESGEKDIHLVVAENYIVEIIKDNKDALPGSYGEIVITDLNNRCLPFIRYKIGDLAVAVDPNRISSCGRGLPLIGKIEGRVQAIIIGTNNNFLPGTFFAHFFKEYYLYIKQYQVVQNELGKINLKIIKTSEFNNSIFKNIILELKKHVGEDMRIDTEYVDDIPMVRTGKHQGTISNLNIDFQNLQSQFKI